MANWKILLALSIVACLGESDVSIMPGPTFIVNNTTTSAPNVTTSSSNPTTKPTTSHPITNSTSSTTSPVTKPTTPNTTSPAPNTTTGSPNTTTGSPKTTTGSPKTTSVTPKPTTPSPSPNTTTASTTVAPTPTPKPVPDPTTGNWSLNYTNTEHSCMVIDAALQIEILIVNSTSEKINIPATAIAGGKCGNTSDNLNLNWEKNTLMMDFVKKVNDSKFELESITAKFVNLTLPSGLQNYTFVHNKAEFSTQLDHSYKCAKVQTLNLTEENQNVTIAYLHISHAQFQAFSNVTGHKFNEAIDCEASTITSDVVPIVVGCVLAILVVVVLVAYLVGRRRCQARGYLSIPEPEDEDETS